MALWTAFIFGLLGSVHCVGMCGPIVIALPGSEMSRSSYLISRILYNLGRAVTYALMGALVGWIGQTIVFAGYQSLLSISLGILILLMIFFPALLSKKLIKIKAVDNLVTKIKAYWGRLFRNHNLLSLFAIGILNGFLPCGFVYIALASAASTATVINGSLYMFMFGLGTIPILLATSYLGKLIRFSGKRFIRNLIPAAGVVLALLIVLRGMSLGIPFISPKIEFKDQVVEKVGCCPTPIEDPKEETTP